MKFTPELLKGSTKNLILAVISAEPLYGYQIVKAIKQQSKGLLTLGEGSIYPALHALERDGFIQGEWERAVEGRNRKYYHLTTKGQRQLKLAKQEWQQFSNAINDVLSLNQV